MNIPIAERMWKLWQKTAVELTMLLVKPRDVRIIMSDGTEVPCRCVFERLDDDGFAFWLAVPETDEPVQADRIRHVEVGELPPWCGGIDVLADEEQSKADGECCQICRRATGGKAN